MFVEQKYEKKIVDTVYRQSEMHKKYIGPIALLEKQFKIINIRFQYADVGRVDSWAHK